jgi:hypothetical protein
MRDNIVQFLSILLLHVFSRGDAAASTSVCFTAARGYVNGPQDCTGGSIFLKGTYIEVGIHSAGSFGTANNAPSGFAYAGRRLGFIADYDKNGFSGTYGFAGDYFVPGTPLEGNIQMVKIFVSILTSMFRMGCGMDKFWINQEICE